MGLLNFIISIVLLGIACWLVWVIGGAMVAAVLELIGRSTPGAKPKRFGKLKKVASRLEKVDALLSQHKCLEAIKMMRKAYVVDIAKTPERIALIKDHHQNFLSRCLLIAEEMGSRADNIAEVERLFIERNELLNLLQKASESYQNLKFRREQAGKNIPSWSQTDFEQRIKEIQKELTRNESELENALGTLFSALGTPTSENIVYH